MYDEPARPSPTPAPIAPPARAIPPPMNAPAVLMAESVTAMSVSLLGWAPGPVLGFLRGVAGCGDSARGFGFRLGGSRGRLLVLLVLVVLGVSSGHAEVEDG